MRRSLLLMLVAALLGAGLLAGCGGDDDGGGGNKEQFESDYRELNDDLRDLGEKVGQAVNTARGKPDAQLATQFQGLSEETEEIKNRLDELEPPEDLEAVTKRLSNAVDVVGSDLAEIGQAAEDHDASAARQQATELVRHSVEVRTARRELARKTGATV